MLSITHTNSGQVAILPPHMKLTQLAKLFPTEARKGGKNNNEPRHFRLIKKSY